MSYVATKTEATCDVIGHATNSDATISDATKLDATISDATKSDVRRFCRDRNKQYFRHRKMKIVNFSA